MAYMLPLFLFTFVSNRLFWKPLSFILTAVQENQEQRSNSSQKEALSTVANRFELQEVCHNNHNDY